MTAELHLQIVGVMLIALAGVNVALPAVFKWREELQKVDQLARQVFFVHLGYIAFVILLMGLLSLLYADALLHAGELGRAILAGLSVFWLSRLIVQWFGYDRRLWLGDRARTVVHVIVTFVWAYFAIVYGWAAWATHV